MAKIGAPGDLGLWSELSTLHSHHPSVGGEAGPRGTLSALSSATSLLQHFPCRGAGNPLCSRVQADGELDWKAPGSRANCVQSVILPCIHDLQDVLILTAF